MFQLEWLLVKCNDECQCKSGFNGGLLLSVLLGPSRAEGRSSFSHQDRMCLEKQTEANIFHSESVSRKTQPGVIAL